MDNNYAKENSAEMTNKKDEIAKNWDIASLELPSTFSPWKGENEKPIIFSMLLQILKSKWWSHFTFAPAAFTKLKNHPVIPDHRQLILINYLKNNLYGKQNQNFWVTKREKAIRHSLNGWVRHVSPTDPLFKADCGN